MLEKRSLGVLAAATVAALSLPQLIGAQQVDGKALYLKNCRQCHGATGVPSATSKAKYPKIRDLTDAEFMAKLSEDSVTHVIRHGKGKEMRPFENKLKDEEMHAIAQYVRTLSAGKGTNED